jgi:potassium-dependent mechanosensitive channel
MGGLFRLFKIRGLAALFLLCVLFAAPGNTQSTSDAQLSGTETSLLSLRLRMDQLKSELNNQSLDDQAIDRLKTAIDSVRLETLAETAKLKGPLGEVNQQLAILGPQGVDARPEAPAMAAQRRILETRSARLNAVQKQFESLNIDASAQLAQLSTIQREQFFERIFKSEKSILNPRLWLEAGAGLWSVSTNLARTTEESFRYARGNASLSGLLLLPLVIGILFAAWTFARRILGIHRKPQEAETTIEQLNPMDRLWRAFLGLLGLLVLVFASAVLILATIDSAEVATPQAKLYIHTLLLVFTMTAIYGGITYFLCAPRSPEARLIAIDDKSARLLPWLVGLAAFVNAIGSETPMLYEALRLPQTGLAGQTALVTAVLIAVLGITTAIIQREANKNQAEGSSYYLTWFVRFLPLLWLALAISLISLLLGYIALSYFIVSSILDTALFVIVLALLHNLADAISETLQNPLSRMGQLMRQYSGFSELGMSRIALVFRTGIDILLVVIAIPTLFLIWALTWLDLSSIFSWVYNGFTVGNITLSPWGMFVAFLVFALGIFLTRTFTSWLQRRVLAETTFDKGVQDSVRTGTSYFGYIIAAALALSAAGLDLSNIALVAGALGVGIGFGLQSIVNNFVSGLILLAERPVRVGDWVVTNAGEGIVKKINVRSTEIETFDNCTVIVPNSNLITESVRNWTHRDTIGRFGVSLIVEQAAQPAVVREIMKSAAASHSKVLRYPEPIVNLIRFINGGMEFELKGTVADVFESGRVASDIRIAVAEALQKKKIALLGAVK